MNNLLSDHPSLTLWASLGSQAITTDSNGQNPAEIRYYPWGTERYTSGTTPTSFHFTGQRLESGIGLYYYGARWYDPSAGRFVQADTVIPDPGSSQDWDRYSYVRNNPIIYTDPSGNKACDGENTDPYECDQINTDDLIRLMKSLFGWTTSGNFTQKEIETLIEAGNDISSYITEKTGKWGPGWIRSTMGNAVFNQNNFEDFINDLIGSAAHVFPSNYVNLRNGAYDETDIIHELAHVLDNNRSVSKIPLPATITGGGPADKMVSDMGGNPSACLPRLQCWLLPLMPKGHQWYIDNVAGTNPWPLRSYGNNGVSDDFAETFTWTIVDQSQVPFGRLNWMTNYVSTIP